MTGTAEAPEVASEQMAQATRGTALNLVGAAVTAVVGFGTAIIITNVYGPEGAGVFFAATALFTLAGNAAKLGAESSLTYFVSRFRTTDRHGSVVSVVRTALMPVAVVSVLLAVAGVLLAPQLAELLTDKPEFTDDLQRMIRILSVALPTWSLSQAMFGATRGFGTMRPSVLSGQIIRPLGQMVFVTAVVLATDSLWLLAVAWGVSSAIALVPVARWLKDRLDKITAEPESVNAEFWAYTRPRALSDILHSALERLDVVLVSSISGSAAAGIYGAANRLILAGQMVMIATAQSMAPHLSAGFAAGNNKATERLLRVITGWNVTILWPLFIGLAFGAEALLPVFGGDFTEATPLVVILSLSFLVITGLGIGDTLLLMTGASVASLVNHIIALVLMLATALILLPEVGVVGAAWAWAISRVSLRALSVIRVWQTHRIHALGRPMIVAALVCVVAYVPTGILARVVLGMGISALVMHVVTGVALHLMLMAAFKKDLHLDELKTVVRRQPAANAA